MKRKIKQRKRNRSEGKGKIGQEVRKTKNSNEEGVRKKERDGKKRKI